jgi:hypothetical protein
MNKIIFVLLLILNGCSLKNTDQQLAKSNIDQNDSYMQTKNGITVREQTESYEFKDASIELLSPQPDQLVTTGHVNFSFKANNYTLGNQTPDADSKLCANSAKGQHIHFILDNEPYKAYYVSEFAENIFTGKHTILAFLSRSYHESIKSAAAYALFNITALGKYLPEDKVTDLKAPHLFYSRPKGEYIGKDTKKILLDFYIVNTTLSENGNKVKASINGTEFLLPAWKAYVIEGLPMGENTLQLELIDNNGKFIPGPYNNSGIRKITLLSEEPVIPAK